MVRSSHILPRLVDIHIVVPSNLHVTDRLGIVPRTRRHWLRAIDTLAFVIRPRRRLAVVDVPREKVVLDLTGAVEWAFGATIGVVAAEDAGGKAWVMPGPMQYGRGLEPLTTICGTGLDA